MANNFIKERAGSRSTRRFGSIQAEGAPYENSLKSLFFGERL
jgi:hypothetical protein